MLLPDMPRSASDESVFQAIACPTRRALLDALAAGERSVSELVAALEVTQSAVSQQLAVLRSAGLVEERPVGRFRYYRVRPEPLAEIETWLAGYRAHVERQLDALGRVLDAMPDEPRATKAPTRRSGANTPRPARAHKQAPRADRRERPRPSAPRNTQRVPVRPESAR
jgi:DNA-binding transcriptional ArsR family regulator